MLKKSRVRHHSNFKPSLKLAYLKTSSAEIMTKSESYENLFNELILIPSRYCFQLLSAQSLIRKKDPKIKEEKKDHTNTAP